MNNDGSNKDKTVGSSRDIISDDTPSILGCGTPTKAGQIIGQTLETANTTIPTTTTATNNNNNMILSDKSSKPIMSQRNAPIIIESPSKLNSHLDEDSRYIQNPQQYQIPASLTPAVTMLPSSSSSSSTQHGSVSIGNSNLLFPNTSDEQRNNLTQQQQPPLSIPPISNSNDFPNRNTTSLQPQYQPNLSQHQPIHIPAPPIIQSSINNSILNSTGSHAQSSSSGSGSASSMNQTHTLTASTNSVQNIQNTIHVHPGKISKIPVLPEFSTVQQQQFTHPPNIIEQYQTQHTSTPNTILGSQNDADTIDNIIKSPNAESDIVERSPGGRYLRFSEKLGSGAYKNVYRAYDTNEGIEVAWNAVNLSGVPKTERARVANEVHLLERLHHSNIISFHGSWANREKEQVIFVTEILSSGTLKQFINKVQVIRWRIAKRWAIQILKGLEYLHSHNPPIIHRDVKCDNIFINGTSGDLRIGDLGLSTAIGKKTQTLSVLGTPEFMAPELYEEYYDEKVDIYAFGMCMLEIFTKEVPYRECSNPAQIYKKVTNGRLPQSLSRIKNKEAQDFIKLCLGAKDGNLLAPRPSASELLTHPFLEQNADDESEVEVGPSITETVITERGYQNDNLHNSRYRHDSVGSVSSPRIAGMALHDINPAPTPIDLEKVSSMDPLSIGQESRLGNKETEITPSVRQQYYSIPTEQGVGVIVTQLPVPLVNTENNLSDADPVSLQNSVGRVEPALSARNHNLAAVNSQLATPIGAVSIDAETEALSQNVSGVPMKKKNEQSQHDKQHNDEQSLVFAAVIEEDEGNPYDDEIMKLIITLPVEGKTQNVQFDFHLVEDDPVQVAREMVRELNIPENALLEISETISGLARSARIRQGRQTHRTSIVNHQLSDPQQRVNLSPRHAGAHPDRIQEVIPTSDLLGDTNIAQPPILNTNIDPNVQASALVYQNTGESIVPTHFTAIGEIPEPLPQAAAAALQSHLHEQDVQTNITDLQSQATNTVQTGHITSPLESLGTIHGSTVNNHGAQNMNNDESPLISLSPERTQNTASQQNRHLPYKNTSQHSNTVMMSDQTSTLLGDAPDLSPFEQSLIRKGSQTDLSLKKDEMDDGHNSDSSDISNSSELRRIREDYQKHLKRAEKAYLTRRDNLIRSKEEREAQHLKTLEKHEKEKAEFEKRLKLAEEEQNKRLRKLEKEWEKKVINARKGKEKSSKHNSDTSSSRPNNSQSGSVESKLMEDVTAMNSLIIDQTSGKDHSGVNNV